MDRRIEKTRKAIFDAFDVLIVKFDYAKISVQNIINKAGVGRSTFYLHFTTKNDLLRAKCVDLLERIFAPIGTETTHASSINFTFEEKIMHILYRLLDNKNVIKGILASEGRPIFLQYFRSYLVNTVENEDVHFAEVPDIFLENHIAGSFIEMVCWWVNCDFSESPENLTRWFLCVLPTLSTNINDNKHLTLNKNI